jgi:tripartite ATP-independent transporter DctP family solute receptor
MKKLIVLLLAMTLVLAACASGDPAPTAPTPVPAPAQPGDQQPAGNQTQEATGDENLVRLAFENSMSEPIGIALQYWRDNLNAMNVGLRAELFPDSQLGSKTDVIDSMLLGEAVITLADGAFYADYGVPDFGIVFGPFLFNNWEEVWTLSRSDWYAQQVAELEARGLTLLASNWQFGQRHLMTKAPVRTADDLTGMRIRVPANRIQTLGFEALGAAAVGMPIGEVYQALQTGVVDGVENPLSVLYSRGFYEVTDYIILTSHVYNFTTWVTSADWLATLTQEQRDALTTTMYEAGIYNNTLAQEANNQYLQRLIDAGVTVYDPSKEVLDGFRERARTFYGQGDEFGWSEGLYERVLQAMGR